MPLPLVGRLHAAVTFWLNRKVCSFIGCKPDWPHAIACGLDRPLCRRCGEPI